MCATAFLHHATLAVSAIALVPGLDATSDTGTTAGAAPAAVVAEALRPVTVATDVEPGVSKAEPGPADEAVAEKLVRGFALPLRTAARRYADVDGDDGQKWRDLR
jgi:hypothetical protein